MPRAIPESAVKRAWWYWLLLAWCVLASWPLRVAARVHAERDMDRVPRTITSYLAWLGTLSPEQLRAVHLAADWFATVHARDMDALTAQLMALEERIRRIEVQRLSHGSD